jgi:divalent metal cation (Fe/Co/Zn/Cd) transporter
MSREKLNKIKMKKLMFITGALSFSLTSVGILFKLMHWPVAGALLAVGIGLFAIVFVPCISKYLYDKEK